MSQELFDRLAKIVESIGALGDRLGKIRSWLCTETVRSSGELLNIPYHDDGEREGHLKAEVLRMVEMSADFAHTLRGFMEEAVSNKVGLDGLSRQLAAAFNAVSANARECERKLAELTNRLKDHSPSDPSVREIVWCITDGKCFYCDHGLARMPEDLGEHYREFHVDHIVAKANGGPDHVSNYVPSCHSCNTAKGAKSFVEFTRKKKAQLSVIGGGAAQSAPSDMEARTEAARLWTAWQEADNRLEDAKMLDDVQITQADFDAVEKLERDAWEAYEAQPLRVLDDGMGNIEKCAITGTPLLVDDEIDYVLRLAAPGANEQEGDDRPMLPEMIGAAG